jgi:hypothetical protein
MLRGALLIGAASTFAGCASSPLAGSRDADVGRPSAAIGGSTNPGGSDPPVWRVLRDTMVDLYDAGISFNPLLLGPVLIRTEP